MKTLKNNLPILICLITIMAISESVEFLIFKLILEVVFMGGLWVIIVAVDYIRDKKPKPKPKYRPYMEINKRPIIEQLNEAYGNKQDRRKK